MKGSDKSLKTGDQLEVQQAGRKSVRDGKAIAGIVLYQLVGNDIGPVDQVKDFKAHPDISKGLHRVVTSS